MWGERHTLDCASCGTELSYHWHDEDPYCSCGDGCLVNECDSCLEEEEEQDEGSYSRNGGCSCDDCRASRDYKPEDEDVLAPPEVLAKLPPLVTGIVLEPPMTVEPPLSPYHGELFTMLGTPGAYMVARGEDRCQCHDCVTRYGEALAASLEAVCANSATTPAGAVRAWLTSADNAGWPS